MTVLDETSALVWGARVLAVLNDPSLLTLQFQPIVDLAHAVVAGYEALARFVEPDGTPTSTTPDRWFAAADRLGHGARLEAMVVRRCLEARRTLPPNTFLTVNVSPKHLTDPAVEGLLLTAGRLDPLVLELTEHEAVVDVSPLVGLRGELLDRGAMLAVDDAGSGYSGLQQLAQFRPQLIKLDRGLVEGADRDEVKLALAQVLGEFGDRIDAWLLAEGIETWGELEAFLRLGVPLGQGFLLGRPSPAFEPLDPAVAQRLRTQAARTSLAESVAGIVEPLPHADPTPGSFGLRIDGRGRPARLLVPIGDEHVEAPISLRVAASTPVAEVARRLVTRPDALRFHPVLVVDDIGVATGVLRVERVLTRLADLTS